MPLAGVFTNILPFACDSGAYMITHDLESRSFFQSAMNTSIPTVTYERLLFVIIGLVTGVCCISEILVKRFHIYEMSFKAHSELLQRHCR